MSPGASDVSKKQKSSTSTAAKVKADDRKNKYIRNSMIFLASFMFTWIWGSVNRIQNMVDPKNPMPFLFYMHAIFTPLQGFNNFIAYSVTSMKWWTPISKYFEGRGSATGGNDKKLTAVGTGAAPKLPLVVVRPLSETTE